MTKKHLTHVLKRSNMRASGGLCSPSLLENGLISHTNAFAITGFSPGPGCPSSIADSGSKSSFVPCRAEGAARQGIGMAGYMLNVYLDRETINRFFKDPCTVCVK